MAQEQKWYQTAYRRAVVDMHIPDWDPAFLSEFDADQYVQRLVDARAQSIVAYAQSHVGLFNYPTKVGQQHRSLKGRDLVQEIIDRCHAHGIAVVIYVSLIFDRWAADNHPEWRMRTWDDQPMGEGGRHGLMCPNSPYREYVRAFATEISQTFAFEGIRFDMTFWPGICYCRHCQERFAAEVGGELPRTVDWLDEKWVAFQRRREQWLVEFAAVATGAVRRHRPSATVEHQSSTFPLDWVFGVTAPLAGQNDFLQGDFYGDFLQGSFVRKLLEDLTPNRPFGFETSFAVDLGNHTTPKSEPLLEAKASAAIADNAAFIFIDGIDPIGTLNPLVYRRMGGIFDRLMPLYPHLGGHRVRDIAVYFSYASKFSFAGNGRLVSDVDRTNAHLDSSMAASRHLLSHHLPFGVISRDALARLAEHRVLVLSGVNMMDEDEARIIRDWVGQGGCLYASGSTSLVDSGGRLQNDFLLGDVFGVSLRRIDWQNRPHYLSPTTEGQALFGTFTPKYPAFSSGYGLEVEALPAAQVLATTTLPWPAPDASRFSSIHSNPPWQSTSRPEVVFHGFGQGRVVYCSSLLELVPGLDRTFVQLLHLLQDEYSFAAQAPASVELTLFYQPERDRYLLTLVDLQKDMPNLPVDDIQVRLRLDGRPVSRIVQLPDNRVVDHRLEEGAVFLTVPRLQTLAMFAVELG